MIRYENAAIAEMGDRCATTGTGRQLWGTKVGANCPVCPHLIKRGLESRFVIRPTIWSQEICAENWVGPRPFGSRGTGSQCKYNAARAEADLHVKFHSNPSIRLASVKTQPDRIGQTGRQTNNGVIIEGKPPYKQSSKQYDRKRWSEHKLLIRKVKRYMDFHNVIRR